MSTEKLRGMVVTWLGGKQGALAVNLNTARDPADERGRGSVDVTLLPHAVYETWRHEFMHATDPRPGDRYSLQALAVVLDIDIVLWSTRGASHDMYVTPGHFCSPPAATHHRDTRKRVTIHLLESLDGIYNPVVDMSVACLK
jgi:hypothetical protein